MKLVIACIGLFVLLTGCAAPVTIHAQDDPPVCSPVAVGTDGVYFLRPTETCPASAYLSLSDAEATMTAGAIESGASTYDDYVLVSDMTRIEDSSIELLVLIRPYSFPTSVLGLTMTRLLKDGAIEGLGTWQDKIV